MFILRENKREKIKLNTIVFLHKFSLRVTIIKVNVKKTNLKKLNKNTKTLKGYIVQSQSVKSNQIYFKISMNKLLI